MLITKFRNKYGKQGELIKYIDTEVKQFMLQNRLTETNLTDLD
jgi:hypothetical protein